MLCMATILSACHRAEVPDPPFVDVPQMRWRQALEKCVPSGEQYECPRASLELAWDCLADYHVDLLACRRDFRAAVQVHKVRLAAAESSGDDWWLWALAGVAVGAAAVGGLWVGCGQ